MATTAGTLKAETSISKRILLWSIALLGIFIVTGVLLAFNYWVAIIFFFVSLLILVRSGLEEYQARGLCLLLVLSLFITTLIGSLALLVLSNNPRIPQLAQSNAAAGIFLGSNLAIVFTSILLGILAATSAIILLLLLVAIATVGILRWHRTDPHVSFSQIFWHLLTTLLGIFHFSVVIDNFEVKGSARDKERLENYGGPGWLTVYPGHVVVLHKWGKITRVVGVDSTILRHEEQIKAILPIRPKGGLNEIQNVLTRDRIPLTITVLHAGQVEQAAETKERLQQAVVQGSEEAKQQLKALESDRLVGDDYNQCYESIAKLVAIKSPDVWDGLKSPVERNLRDAIMSEDFEELFNLGDGDEGIAGRISRRKIEAIEKIVFEKAKQAKISDGVLLRVVDIIQVRFPEEIEEKVRAEITALAEARIKNTEADTREKTAVTDSNIMIEKAKARRIARVTDARGELEAAKFRAEATKIRAQARAEHFKQIVQVLRQQNQSEETIKTILQHVATSNASIHYIRSEQTINAPSEPNGNHEQNLREQRFDEPI